MSSYDSILKEKKVYASPEPVIKKNKYTKYIVIDFVLILLLLIICYIVYYRMILTPKNILIDHLENLKSDVSVVLDPLMLPIDDNSYNFVGDFSFDNYKYDYQVIRNDDESKLILNYNKSDLVYYIHDDYSYLQATNLLNGSYVLSDYFKHINAFYNFQNHFSDAIDKISFLKNIYIDGTLPVVELNFSLDSNNISEIFGDNFTNDNIEVIVTIKINGLTSSLINSKYIVNNKTKNTRNVFEYADNVLTLTDNNGKKIIFELSRTKSDFVLKIVKDDAIYSVLTGSSVGDEYNYAYQIIDKIYSLELSVSTASSITSYKFQSNIEQNGQKVKKNMIIQKKREEEIIFNEKLSTSLKYSDLDSGDKNKFDKYVDDFLLPIRDFIDKHKDSVD